MRMNAQVAAAEVRLARARGDGAVAERAFRVLLHLRENEPTEVGETLVLSPTAISEPRPSLIRRALERRSELRALRELARAQEHERNASAGEYFPRVSVLANLDYANPNPRFFEQEDTFNATWTVGAQIGWSPNDALRANAQVTAANARAAQTRADIARLGDAIRLEVTRALESHEAARTALAASQVGIEAAEESYRVRLAQLRAGTAVTRDLIDAEAELTQARLELLNAAIDERVARARLTRAVAE
jgi:outer membrane protein TolC